MSTIDVQTIHTCEYQEADRRLVAPAGTILSMDREQAESLKAIGALTILKKAVPETKEAVVKTWPKAKE